MSRRVLITGGFGYVGARVAQTLAGSGRRSVVLGTRRPIAGAPDWLAGAGIACLDWASTDGLHAACAGIDEVVHLAAMNEIESALDPAAALEANGAATLKLLEAAIAAGVKRLIYLSTAHVYGAPLAGAIDEATLPRPNHPYAITHKVAEDFVLAAGDRKRIEGVVLRLSNSFGAPTHPQVDRWTLLVNDLCRQAAVSGELRLKSSGMQRRDFITLEDTAGAVLHVLDLDVAALGDGLFNLGGRRALRVIDMAEMIAARCEVVAGFRPPVLRPPSAPGEADAVLEYSCAKLEATGFQWTSRHSDEIDATLRLCFSAFSRA